MGEGLILINSSFDANKYAPLLMRGLNAQTR